MNDLSIAVQTIKDSVSALDVARAMGWDVRHGRCRCPIHGGHDYNCRLYPGDRGFVCWVCKAGGDVIKLVRESQGMGFGDAVTWFNDTFGLEMNIDSPMDPEALRRARKRLEEQKRIRDLEMQIDRLRFEMYLAADRVLTGLEEIRDGTAPTKPDGDWDGRFAFAVRMIPEAKRLAMECEMNYNKKGG